MFRMSCRQWQLFPFWKQPLSSQVPPLQKGPCAQGAGELHRQKNQGRSEVI